MEQEHRGTDASAYGAAAREELMREFVERTGRLRAAWREAIGRREPWPLMTRRSGPMRRADR